MIEASILDTGLHLNFDIRDEDGNQIALLIDYPIREIYISYKEQYERWEQVGWPAHLYNIEISKPDANFHEIKCMKLQNFLDVLSFIF